MSKGWKIFWFLDQKCENRIEKERGGFIIIIIRIHDRVWNLLPTTMNSFSSNIIIWSIPFFFFSILFVLSYFTCFKLSCTVLVYILSGHTTAVVHTKQLDLFVCFLRDKSIYCRSQYLSTSISCFKCLITTKLRGLISAMQCTKDNVLCQTINLEYTLACTQY